MSRVPRVSVAVPVFNGERYLAGALECLLRQTFTDFELVICDNASTDRTPQIARAAEARDPRVRYLRFEENVGAAPNFQRAFGACRGELFKWAACDDECTPDLLERSVAALDASPDAVLAHPLSWIIDEDSQRVERYELRLPTGAPDPVTRFSSMLRGHACYQVFGLIRREALARTQVMGAYAFGDRVLLAHLALLGRFVEIPEYLFFPRRHGGQSMTLVRDRQRYAVWFDHRLRGRKLFPHWRLFAEMARAVLAVSSLDGRTRARCLRRVAQKAWVVRGKLGADVRFHLAPPRPVPEG